MKIRWSHLSVRFRVTPSELESLQNQQPIAEELEFGNGGWEATISVGETRQFWFEKMILQVQISPADVAELAAPENEGVYFSTDSEPPIRYFIEKDFPCAHPRAAEAAEAATETFEAPPDFERRKQQNEPSN